MIGITNRLMNATHYSLAGLKTLFHSEFAFKLEIMIVILLTAIIYLLDVEFAVQLLLLILLWLLLIVEAINSAIETIINRISFEQHELSKRAKDIGSAAVFLTLLLNTFAWFLVLIH